MPAAPKNISAHTAPDNALSEAASPDVQVLLALARARLARELESLPPWGSPLLRARLFAAPTSPTSENGSSHGALVHFIRRAVALGDTSFAHDLFTLLLQRIEGLNHRWAYRTLASGMEDRQSGYEELRQELALRLWEHIGRGDHEAWELFFQRALTFEQRRLATRLFDRMERMERMRQPTLTTNAASGGSVRRSTLRPAQSLQAWNTFEQALQRTPSLTIADLADRRDMFAAAELADLRSHVALLPIRERQATLLRFWCSASEEEIAHALGGVTTRTVRNLLTRAYAHLRRMYAPEVDPQSQQRNGGQHA